jgi:hypothetical protein
MTSGLRLKPPILVDAQNVYRQLPNARTYGAATLLWLTLLRQCGPAGKAKGLEV